MLLNKPCDIHEFSKEDGEENETDCYFHIKSVARVKTKISQTKEQERAIKIRDKKRKNFIILDKLKNYVHIYIYKFKNIKYYKQLYKL